MLRTISNDPRFINAAEYLLQFGITRPSTILVYHTLKNYWAPKSLWEGFYKDLSEDLDISTRYIEKAIQELKKANLIETHLPKKGLIYEKRRKDGGIWLINYPIQIRPSINPPLGALYIQLPQGLHACQVVCARPSGRAGDREDGDPADRQGVDSPTDSKKQKRTNVSEALRPSERERSDRYGRGYGGGDILRNMLEKKKKAMPGLLMADASQTGWDKRMSLRAQY